MKKLIALILSLTLVFALAACGGSGDASGSADSGSGATSEVKSADLQAFYDSTFSGEDMPAMMPLETEALDAFYTGLSALELKQCIVAMPMISQVAAEIALVEVADAADLETVQNIFQARIDYQIDQGAFYPASVEVWENYCEIVIQGNTIMMIAMNPNESIVEGFNALFA